MRRRTLIGLTAALLVLVLPAASFVAGARVAERNEPEGFDRIEAAGRRILDESALSVSVEDLVDAAIRGMLGALGDPYAALLDPEDQQHLRELVDGGSVVGIGVWINSEDSGLRVSAVIPETPADRAGLAAGDLIVSVNGKPIEAGSPGEASSPLSGKAGTSVRLEIVRGDRRFSVELRRERIPVPNIIPRRLPSGVGYVALLQFGEGASGELRAAVTDLLRGGAPGIVLDLRDNPGGVAHEAFDAANVFVGEGLLGTIEERGSEPLPVVAEGTALRQDFPLVVLVNGGTASAAEILAAALSDRGRATLVGSKTFGKGSVLSVVPVDEEGPTIQFTTAFFIRPDGRRIEGRGVVPDVPVSRFGPGDPQLRRAVQLVLGRA